MIDKVFSKKKETIETFEFNEEVTQVFDDMIARSVPFYKEIHKIIIDIYRKMNFKDEVIYDLGCSTGSTIKLIHQALPSSERSPFFIGIDNSPSMINECHKKLSNEKGLKYELLQRKIQDVELKSSKLIIMNYTLQFIPKDLRLTILKKVYNSLQKGGIFIMSEKVKPESLNVHTLFTDLYYDFKRRNGYSNLEIMQKREALENFLIPNTIKEQKELIKEAGFKSFETIFQWYNFSSFIGIK
ncbi:MAG: carboxy-S-adenosyl-L-methionine synthase CmoA [Halobacteriovoraceae bacterium]|nr:carboxy-S-adenosyl-L-methionine synthase CmoA [Halobacteriovoraceae bacterium]|tara:strand:- start:360 stop:1085 length:726 start_codon:yes stop_codon:yes gene_type:complete